MTQEISTWTDRFEQVGKVFCIVQWLSALVLLAYSTVARPVAPAAPEEAGAVAVQKAVGSLDLAMQTQPDRFKGIERVAVIPLRGDPHKQVTDLVQIRMTRTPFKIMMRDEVERVLAEQQFALDYADLFQNHKETVAKLGNLLGVQAYLIGDVVSTRATARGGSETRINLKLVDVETAQVLWGEAVAGEAAPQPIPLNAIDWLRPTAISLFALSILVAAAIAFGRGGSAGANRRGDREQRARIAQELLKGIAALREAEQNAGATQAERLRALRNRLDTLRRAVDGAIAPRKPRTAAELGPWQDFAAHMISEVTAKAQAIHDLLLAGRDCCLEAQVDNLEAGILRVQAVWADRAGVLAR